MNSQQPNYLKYKYFSTKARSSSVSSTGIDQSAPTALNDSNNQSSDSLNESTTWDSTEGLTVTAPPPSSSTKQHSRSTAPIPTPNNNNESSVMTDDSFETSSRYDEEELGASPSMDDDDERIVVPSSSSASNHRTRSSRSGSKSKSSSSTLPKSQSTLQAVPSNPTPPSSYNLNTNTDNAPPTSRSIGPSPSAYNIHNTNNTSFFSDDESGKGKNQMMSWLSNKSKNKNMSPPTAMKDGGQLVNLVNPQRTLSKELKVLVNTPDFCDVVFVLEDKPLYAHRAILAARCPKFQQMFNAMKDPRPEIPIPNIRYAVFLGMMHFLYSDSVDISLELCLELLGAATQFSLDLLKSLCERILEQSINAENVGWIFQGADRYKATRLREICLSFIVKSFDSVSKTKAFEDLSRDLIIEIIKKR